MNRRMEMQKENPLLRRIYRTQPAGILPYPFIQFSLNPKIRRSSKPFLFALPNQHSADLILILRNILMHIQRFLNIEIHVFAVLVSYDTVAFSLTEKFYRLRTHDGSVNSVLTGRRAASLHVAQNRCSRLYAGSRLQFSSPWKKNGRCPPH